MGISNKGRKMRLEQGVGLMIGYGERAPGDRMAHSQDLMDLF